MNENEKKHDYTDTVKHAAGVEETEHERIRDDARMRKNDAELAYELLAVNSSMGMLGMEETNANLIQLELAAEIMHNFDPESNQDDYLE